MSAVPSIGAHLGHALHYAAQGLEVFHVRADKKPWISQYTATTDAEFITAWWSEHPEALIGHRLPDEVVILDVDPRHGGDDTYRALKAEIGRELIEHPPRAHVSGRGDGGGHLWFQRPPGELYIAGLDDWARIRKTGHAFGTRWSGGIDLLQRNHRYTILPPSPHPDTGLPYQWVRGLDHALTPMPKLLVELLTTRPAPVVIAQPDTLDRIASSDSIADWYTDNSSWSDLLTGHGWEQVQGGWRHPNATSSLSATITNDCLFVYSPNTPFEPTAPGDTHGYTRFRAFAVLEHQGDLAAAGRAARLTRTVTPTPRQGTGVATTVGEEAIDVRPRFLIGGAWLLDAPTTAPSIWGEADEVLWAEGEPLLLTGPPGVGKTTLIGQLLRARLGLQETLLGWPVVPDTKGKVLYLASDRPSQIRRAIGRSFTEADRAVLDERLVIWPGPPATDLGKHPEHLAQLCNEAGATTVILDSLKDMALGLSDDEVGAGLNRSLQTAIAEGIEVVALHHQRKGTDGKRPKTLEDLYGSTWISAGAGSVILLWGQAGDLVVDLIHLKQPASDVGPLKLTHDHDAGLTTIERGFDVSTFLKNHRMGITALAMARIWLEKDAPSENDRKKAQRKLDALVKEHKAVREEGERQPDGTMASFVYRWTGLSDLC